MKQKHLESALSSITRDFPDPQVNLEQYATSSHLVASVILMALRNGDVGEGRTVLDLGCGTGMLTIGAALVGSDMVLGLDIDGAALEVAQSNVNELELQHSVQLIQAQVPYYQPDNGADIQQQTTTKERANSRQNHRTSGGRSQRGRRPSSHQRGGRRAREIISHGRFDSTGQNQNHGRDGESVRLGTNQAATTECVNDTIPREPNKSICTGLPLRDKCVDTVLTNPPFGTKDNAGIDVQFLKWATRLARNTVYSFHKTSTRAFLLRTIEQWGFQAQVAAEMKFDLPNVYKFHRQDEVNIQVDLLRTTIVQADMDNCPNKETECAIIANTTP